MTVKLLQNQVQLDLQLQQFLTEIPVSIVIKSSTIYIRGVKLKAHGLNLAHGMLTSGLRAPGSSGLACGASTNEKRAWEDRA